MKHKIIAVNMQSIAYIYIDSNQKYTKTTH